MGAIEGTRKLIQDFLALELRGLGAKLAALADLSNQNAKLTERMEEKKNAPSFCTVVSRE